MKKNIPQDLKFNYKAHIYKKVDKYLDMETHEKILMLSLLGFKNDLRYPLNTPDPAPANTEDKLGYGSSYEMSLRTMYPKNNLAFDAVFGLMGLLTSKEKDPEKKLDEVFLTTSESKISFLELPSVKATFEFMLGGLDIIEEVMFDLGNSQSAVADAIQIFLEQSLDELNVLVD
jgi:hypothetical protein